MTKTDNKDGNSQNSMPRLTTDNTENKLYGNLGYCELIGQKPESVSEINSDTSPGEIISSKVIEKMNMNHEDKVINVTNENRTVSGDMLMTDDPKTKEPPRPKSKELLNQVVNMLDQLFKAGHIVVLVFDSINRMVPANKTSKVSFILLIYIFLKLDISDSFIAYLKNKSARLT